MVLQSKILLVDDADHVRETMAQALTKEGYSVTSVENARELLSKLPLTSPDIVLLDLILPDGNGLSLIGRIREYTDAPVLVISSKTEMVNRVLALEMGADDYIAKPVEIIELAARIRAHLRRYKTMAEKADGQTLTNKKGERRIKFDVWTLDQRQFQVFDEDGNSGDLTVKEFRLLESLILDSGCVLSRDQLLDKAYAGNYDITDRAIDVQITRIRKKLGDCATDPGIIRSVRGIGYTLVPKPEVIY